MPNTRRPILFATLFASLSLGIVSCSKVSETPAQEPSKTVSPAKPMAQSPSEHTAYFISTDRANLGKVTLKQTETGITARVEIDGISAGEHGMHFHQIGDCSDVAFKASGGHINPGNMQHGLKNTHGPDNADLPNLSVAQDGSADQIVTNDRLSFYGEDGRPALFDENGSAMVIHESPDDQVTQPIGGAGARIACAVITQRESD